MIPDGKVAITSVVDEHPCFSEGASYRYGRIHLPVAPKCNIQCNYCDRKYDCVNESRPGVTSRVISPEEATSRVEEVTGEYPNIRVAGIAGPGDPLFNETTFETLRLINDRFPDMHKCISTNGLLLVDKVTLLKESGVDTLTVTLNAVEPVIGAKIYSFVYYQGERLKGIEAAMVLLNNQLAGIKIAIEAGITVKVNTVLIPNINDNHIIEVARKIKELGVYMHNIMPLIPLAGFADGSPPSPDEITKLRDECGWIVRQMTHCRQCRADAIGLLHEDVSAQFRC